MSREAFFAYLRDVHGALATAEPGTVACYRQNHVLDMVAGVDGDSHYAVDPDRDNITEVMFDDLPALFDDLSRPYVREKVGPDGANFSDKETATALVTTNHELVAAQAGLSTAKVIAFLSAPQGVSTREFDTQCRASFAESGWGELASLGGALTWHERVAEGDAIVGYFGGTRATAYDAVVTFRLPSAETALSVAGRFLDDHRAVIDLSRSWRALVKETVIYERRI